MIGWFVTTMGAAALGSVFPVINIELYLVGVLTAVSGLSWWALALAATIGQLAGKVLFFLAGRGSITLGSRLSGFVNGKRTRRWADWAEKFHQRCRRRPGWGLATLFAGAVTGIPPFTLMCFLTGAAGIGWTSFLAVSFLGRTIHFMLVAGAPQLVGLLTVG